jgi:hypothetical protein
LGTYYFGDWLRDDCSTALIDDEGKMVFTPSPPWADKKFYSDLFEMKIPVSGLAAAKHVIFYDDKHQNDNKVARIQHLRSMLEKKKIPFDPPEIVYVRRGKDGESRKIINEEEIILALKRRGVICISPDDPEPILSRIYGCSLFISMGGSQISHAMFCLKSSGGLLVLQRPDKFYNPHMDWAVPLGIKYGSIVGNLIDGDLRFCPNEILRAIDLF